MGHYQIRRQDVEAIQLVNSIDCPEGCCAIHNAGDWLVIDREAGTQEVLTDTVFQAQFKPKPEPPAFDFSKLPSVVRNPFNPSNDRPYIATCSTAASQHPLPRARTLREDNLPFNELGNSADMARVFLAANTPTPRITSTTAADLPYGRPASEACNGLHD